MIHQTATVFHHDPAHPSAARLTDALTHAGRTARPCPHTATREALAWALQLDPSEPTTIIIHHHDPAAITGLLSACPPGNPIIIWCPDHAGLSAIAPLIATAPVLLSPAADIETFIQTLQLGARKELNEADGCEEPALPTKEELHAADGYREPALPVASDDDHAAYQELESLMATRAKPSVATSTQPRPDEYPPVQVRALDFTMPLRSLMARGKNLAAQRNHAEVHGLHYLASLEVPFSTPLNAAGLTLPLIEQGLSALPAADSATDPLVHDEIFVAIATAKAQARAQNQLYVRTIDLVHALIGQPSGSVAELLRAADLAGDDILDDLAPLYEVSENPPSPFFQPSSLDQAGFAELDPDKVQAITERLQKLPAFQKAAAPVKEATKAAGGSAASQPVPAAPAITLNDITPPPKPELLPLSPSFPDVTDIEYLADRLLEGHVIGFPSDIMYALAADASNPYAIQRLRQASGKPDDQPLGLLLHSTSQLKHLVNADLDALEELLDQHWPGPLTLIFRAAGTLARHVSTTQTVALRQPADDISLAILSMIGRPLAVTSFNDVQPDSPVDVKRLAERLGGQVSILAHNQTPVQAATTTVIDLTEPGWPIVRQGAIPGDMLKPYQPPE